MLWIEGSNQRFYAYSYFGQHPERLIGWFDRSMHATEQAPRGRDYGDTVLKLRLQGDRFETKDYFTPFDQQQLNSRDEDLGSGGPLLLPEHSSGNAGGLVFGGKRPSLLLRFGGRAEGLRGPEWPCVVCTLTPKPSEVAVHRKHTDRLGDGKYRRRGVDCRDACMGQRRYACGASSLRRAERAAPALLERRESHPRRSRRSSPLRDTHSCERTRVFRSKESGGGVWAGPGPFEGWRANPRLAVTSNRRERVTPSPQPPTRRCRTSPSSSSRPSRWDA